MARALLGALFLALCIVGPARAQQIIPQGPCLPQHFLGAATSGGQIVQAATGPHSLCGFIAITSFSATTSGDVRFYDTSSQTLCSLAAGTAPVLNFPVPTNPTAANVAGMVIPLGADIVFKQGIAVCYSGAVSDVDTTTPYTSVQVNFGVR